MSCLGYSPPDRGHGFAWQDAGVARSALPRAAAIVEVDAGRITVLLNNLVKNALRCVPAAGVVDVEAALTEGRPTLRVVDPSPGIPKLERERVFGRFYRACTPAARPRSPEARVSGWPS